MNLYHLRYFTVLAHLEHYTKAAEKLSITQPTLSHAISSLEKEIGVSLFEKDGRNVVLTKIGKVFLKDVEDSLNILDASVKKLKLTSVGEGTIDVALLRTLSSQIVPQLVKGFIQLHPDKRIDFRFHNSTGLSADIIQGLKDRTYDLAFCSKMRDEAAIDYIPFAKQNLVLAVPADHPLAGCKSIDLKETLSYPQIWFSKKSGLRPIIEKLFQHYNEAPEILLEVDEDETVAGLVSQGFGIAVLPDLQLLSLLNIKVIEIEEPKWERLFYLAYLKTSYQIPVIESFKQFVKDHAIV